MAIDVSPEAELKARQIPDFPARLERFINDQFALEQWRKRHTSSETASVVQQGMRQGEALLADGIDRAELFARLNSLSERISRGTRV